VWLLSHDPRARRPRGVPIFRTTCWCYPHTRRRWHSFPTALTTGISLEGWRASLAEPITLVLAAFIAVLRLERTVVFRMPWIFSVALKALPVLPTPAGRVEFAPFGVCLARFAVFCGRWAHYPSHSLPLAEEVIIQDFHFAFPAPISILPIASVWGRAGLPMTEFGSHTFMDITIIPPVQLPDSSATWPER
jgi:hypothetical protein